MFSDLHDGKARYTLEVTEIQRGHVVAQMHRRCADEQIFEGKPYSFRSLLAFNASGESRDFKRHRMHRDISRQPVDELQPAVLLLLAFGAISSVNQFGDAHDGNADLDLAALRRAHLF